MVLPKLSLAMFFHDLIDHPDISGVAYASPRLLIMLSTRTVEACSRVPARLRTWGAFAHVCAPAGAVG